MQFCVINPIYLLIDDINRFTNRITPMSENVGAIVRSPAEKFLLPRSTMNGRPHLMGVLATRRKQIFESSLQQIFYTCLTNH